MNFIKSSFAVTSAVAVLISPLSDFDVKSFGFESDIDGISDEETYPFDETTQLLIDNYGPEVIEESGITGPGQVIYEEIPGESDVFVVTAPYEHEPEFDQVAVGDTETVFTDNGPMEVMARSSSCSHATSVTAPAVTTKNASGNGKRNIYSRGIFSASSGCASNQNWNLILSVKRGVPAIQRGVAGSYPSTPPGVRSTVHVRYYCKGTTSNQWQSRISFSGSSKQQSQVVSRGCKH